MATDMLCDHHDAEGFDIHFGGIDLIHPHHTCEVLQSEAYFASAPSLTAKSAGAAAPAATPAGVPWANRFMHIGHLNIEGLKMSKSLKNFITIEDALKKYTSRQIRILFLLHPWQDTINFSDDTMNHAITTEFNFLEFFSNVTLITSAHSCESAAEREHGHRRVWSPR